MKLVKQLSVLLGVGLLPLWVLANSCPGVKIEAPITMKAHSTWQVITGWYDPSPFPRLLDEDCQFLTGPQDVSYGVHDWGLAFESFHTSWSYYVNLEDKQDPSRSCNVQVVMDAPSPYLRPTVKSKDVTGDINCDVDVTAQTSAAPAKVAVTVSDAAS